MALSESTEGEKSCNRKNNLLRQSVYLNEEETKVVSMLIRTLLSNIRGITLYFYYIIMSPTIFCVFVLRARKPI